MVGAGVRNMSGAGLLVVGSLTGSLLLCVLTACAFTLIHPDRPLPEHLVQLLLTLTPLVAGLLAKTYADAKQVPDGAEPAPVNVVNTASDPVVTTDVPAEEGGGAHALEDEPLARRRR